MTKDQHCVCKFAFAPSDAAMLRQLLTSTAAPALMLQPVALAVARFLPI
jgi:hypothetical protein